MWKPQWTDHRFEKAAFSVYTQAKSLPGKKLSKFEVIGLKRSLLCADLAFFRHRRRGQANDDKANPTSYLFDIDCSYISCGGQAFEKDGFQMIGDSTLPADSSEQAVESQNERFVETKSL